MVFARYPLFALTLCILIPWHAQASEPLRVPLLQPQGHHGAAPDLTRSLIHAPQGTPLPALEPVLTNRERDNLCPVCKKSRSECYTTYQESLTNPALRDQVCDIYKKNIGHMETRPVPCPVCRHQVHAPTQVSRHDDVDTDLCPHPIGNVRIVSEVTTCPSCGFSAFQGDFRRPQSEATRQWVRNHLTEALREDQHYLLDMNIKLTEQELVDLFGNQEEIPDIIRTANAFLYYERLLAAGDPNINEAGLAQVAYMTAWSFRREVGKSLFGPLVTEPIRRINSSIRQKELLLNDLKGHADFLHSLALDTKRWGHFDRQIIHILQAGYYARMGRHRLSNALLANVMQEAKHRFPDAESDPWFHVIADQGQTGQQRARQVEIARTLIENEAMRRLVSLRREAEYLERAVQLITRGLETGQYNVDEIPSYIFLVGDFERRRENFSRAMMWLRAADHLKASGEFRIEHQAPAVIEDMLEYISLLDITPPPDPNQSTDWRLLQILAQKVHNHRTRNEMQTSAPGSATPHPRNPGPRDLPAR